MRADALSTTFAALADPTRRAILERLADGDATVQELAAPHSISQPAISKHLKVLEQAGLVVKSTERQWRRCSLVATPLADADAWLTPYRMFFESRIARLERQLQKEKR